LAAPEVVATLVKGTYTAAFFDYVATNGVNARAGSVMAVWNGASIEFTDNSTSDIGNTTPVVLSVIINGSNIELIATVSSNNWIIKSLIRAL